MGIVKAVQNVKMAKVQNVTSANKRFSLFSLNVRSWSFSISLLLLFVDFADFRHLLGDFKRFLVQGGEFKSKAL